MDRVSQFDEKIAVHTVAKFLEENPEKIDLVEWVLFDDNTLKVYEAAVEEYYKSKQ